MALKPAEGPQRGLVAGLLNDLFKLIYRLLVPLVVVGAVVWWFTFGTFSPCDALRSEARRVSSAEAGAAGSFVAGALADSQTSEFTPWECFVGAIKVRTQGASGLADLIVRGRASVTLPQQKE